MSSVSFLKAEKKNAKSISYYNIVHNPWGLIDQSTNYYYYYYYYYYAADASDIFMSGFHPYFNLICVSDC